MIETKLTKTPEGVNINFQGGVKKASIVTMVQACRDGSCGCDCDPSTMQQIKQMEISGNDGDITVSLRSDTLDVQSIEEAMKGCDIPNG